MLVACCYQYLQEVEDLQLKYRTLQKDCDLYKHRMNTVLLQLEEIEKERDQVNCFSQGSGYPLLPQWIPMIQPCQGGRCGSAVQFCVFSRSQSPDSLQAIQSRDGVQLQYSQSLIEKDHYRKRVRALEEERDELQSKLSQAEGLNGTLQAQLQRCRGGRGLSKVRVARRKRKEGRQRGQD